MAEEPSLSYYLPIAGGRIIGFIPFPRVLVLCEMQSVSSRIWTRIAVFISYGDNDYTTGTSTLNGSSLRLVDKFTFLCSSVSSTETDINIRLAKAWTAIDRLSVIWKSDLTDEIKRTFYQAAVVSILVYWCTSWTLTKRMEKRLDDNYTIMLRAILNKSWRQHPTK